MNRKPIFLSLVLSAAASAWSGELANPSFEQPASAPDQANHWARWGEWIAREAERTPARDGKAVVAYRPQNTGKSDSSGIWQDIAGVKAGERYTFSIHAYRDTPTDGPAGGGSVELRLESTFDGHQLVIQSQSYGAGEIAAGGKWARLKITGTAAADSLRVIVAVHPDGKGARAGAIMFDAAALHLESGP